LWTSAIASYDKALEINPDKDAVWNNKACCYGLQGNVEQAIQNLQQAIRLDAKYREMAKTDTDFDPIRKNPEFQALLQE
jgi:tetratricopeptide (TPR) repeat protein